jgi:hypothetical protein
MNQSAAAAPPVAGHLLCSLTCSMNLPLGTRSCICEQRALKPVRSTAQVASGRDSVTDIYSTGKSMFFAMIMVVTCEIGLLARYWTWPFVIICFLSYTLVGVRVDGPVATHVLVHTLQTFALALLEGRRRPVSGLSMLSCAGNPTPQLVHRLPGGAAHHNLNSGQQAPTLGLRCHSVQPTIASPVLCRL